MCIVSPSNAHVIAGAPSRVRARFLPLTVGIGADRTMTATRPRFFPCDQKATAITGDLFMGHGGHIDFQ